MVQPIVPAILAHARADFRSKLCAVQAYAPLIHVDVMDGVFVPSRSGDHRSVVARWPAAVSFEVHLMAQEPRRLVTAWGAVPKVERIIVHAEATDDLPTLLVRVYETGKRVGLAVNPRTRIATILPYLGHVDTVLLMANDPGFSGRPFRKSTLARVRALRAIKPKLRIGVDIGMNAKTIPLVRRAGATFACVGSAIFTAKDPADAYRVLTHAFRTAV